MSLSRGCRKLQGSLWGQDQNGPTEAGLDIGILRHRRIIFDIEYRLYIDCARISKVLLQGEIALTFSAILA